MYAQKYVYAQISKSLMQIKLTFVHYNLKTGIKKEKGYLLTMNLIGSASLMQFSTLMKILRKIFSAEAVIKHKRVIFLLQVKCFFFLISFKCIFPPFFFATLVRKLSFKEIYEIMSILWPEKKTTSFWWSGCSLFSNQIMAFL